MAKCPECGGKTKYRYDTKSIVCQSCGLAMTRSELESFWRKVRTQNITEIDESQKKKNKRKDWLDWYSKSKSEKERY